MSLKKIADSALFKLAKDIYGKNTKENIEK